MNEPWSKFFWSDYDADEGLRMCSLAAQGLWMRMLCLMARAIPKGELRVGGEPCTVTDLSRAVGESEEMVSDLLAELARRGVSSTNRTGVIYSRRLRKDAEISRKRAKSGAKGAAVTNLKYKDNTSLPQQNASKPPGKEAAPEARSQKLERKNNNNQPYSTNPRETVDRLDDWVENLAYELCDLAGMSSSTPGTITAAIGITQQWTKDGIDVEATIKPTMRKMITASDEPTHSLRRFDKAIRHEHAKLAASGTTHSAPLSPDEQIARFEDHASRLERIGRSEDAAEIRQQAQNLRTGVH